LVAISQAEAALRIRTLLTFAIVLGATGLKAGSSESHHSKA